MASQPVGFAELLLGGLLTVSAITNTPLRGVLSGQATAGGLKAAPLTSGPVSVAGGAPTATGVTPGRVGQTGGAAHYGALVTGGQFAGQDQGVDFTGAGTIKALGNGVITSFAPQNAISSGTGWPGQAGPGTGGRLVYQLTDGPQAGRFVYLTEAFTATKNFVVGEKIKAGQSLATFFSSYPGTESGFAQNAQGQAYGVSTKGVVDPQSNAFVAFVESLLA